jgi:hypothetical protein
VKAGSMVVVNVGISDIVGVGSMIIAEVDSSEGIKVGGTDGKRDGKSLGNSVAS